MKILIIIGHNRWTGVNSWAIDLAKGLNADIELRKEIVFDYNNNVFQQLLKDIIVSDPNYADYDMIITSYKEHLDRVKTFPHIFVSHGIDYGGNHPNFKPNIHVGVSERITNYFKADYTIHNGINLHTFRPFPTNENGKPIVLYHSRGHVPEILRSACELLGYPLFKPLYGTPNKLIAQVIRNTDIVVGYGRSAYEGMACGKPTLLYGHYGCDGWVDDDFENKLKNNCNGSYANFYPTVQELCTTLESYKEHSNTRLLAEKFLNYKQMTDKYLRIINKWQMGM